MIDFLIDFTSEWNEISVFSKMFKGRKTTSTNNFKQDRKSAHYSDFSTDQRNFSFILFM